MPSLLVCIEHQRFLNMALPRSFISTPKYPATCRVALLIWSERAVRHLIDIFDHLCSSCPWRQYPWQHSFPQPGQSAGAFKLCALGAFAALNLFTHMWILKRRSQERGIRHHCLLRCSSKHFCWGVSCSTAETCGLSRAAKSSAALWGQSAKQRLHRALKKNNAAEQITN